MELAATLLLLICYGLAAYLAWAEGTPLYLIALVAGHLSSIASPLWRLLYGVNYSLDLTIIQMLLGQSAPLSVIIGAGWYYPLPALVIYYLYSVRWWFPGIVSGVITYIFMLFYYLLIEILGLRAQIWGYTLPRLPLGLSAPLVAAPMSALVAYGLLYGLLLVHRHTWQGMLMLILPAPLVLSLLVHGLLGAPLWVALLFNGQPPVVLAGLICTLLLMVWAGQIITSGLRRIA